MILRHVAHRCPFENLGILTDQGMPGKVAMRTNDTARRQLNWTFHDRIRAD